MSSDLWGILLKSRQLSTHVTKSSRHVPDTVDDINRIAQYRKVSPAMTDWLMHQHWTVMELSYALP